MKYVPIGSKIAVSFGIVFVLLIIMGLMSYNALNMVQDDQDWVDHTYRVLMELGNLESHLKDAETGQRGYLITGETRYLEPYNESVSEIDNHLNEIARLTSDNLEQQNRLSRIRPLVQQKIDELKETITLREIQGFEAAREVVLSDLGKEVMDSIRLEISLMIEEEDSLLQQRYNQSSYRLKALRITILGISLLSLLIVVILTLFLSRRIAGPIKGLSIIANQISNGDLTGTIAIGQNDEIGQLADSFTLMQESMRLKAEQAIQISQGNLSLEISSSSEKDTMGQAFKTMIENLRSQISETKQASEIIASSSSQISSTVAQLTSSIAETVTAINETSTTMKEVSQTIQVADEKAKYVSDMAQKTEESSNKGESAVEETSAGMSRINEHMESIAKNIINLSEQSQSIAKIINTVDDIAEQTNLLSVNAAIEAEKAGDQGKGFNVVAQEIKNLADKSKKSTEQIREILEDILKVTGTAVMSTEQGSKAVSEGMQLSQLAGESINVLVDSIKESAQAAFQIVASSREQKTGVGQVTQAMENINQASNQNLEGTRQLESSAKSLNNLGLKLNELISWYRI